MRAARASLYKPWSAANRAR